MNQATKEAVATIAALPEKERKQALAITRSAGNIYEEARRRANKGRVVTNLNECSAYKGCRQQHGKEVADEALSLMGFEIKGGDGGPGNKLTATLKKI